MLGGMAPAPEGIPGFDYDTVLTYVLLQFGVLVVQMVFVLNDGRHDLSKRENFLHGLWCVIIGDADGDSMDAYTYSGTFRSTGKRITGTATLNSDSSVATFTQDGVSL